MELKPFSVVVRKNGSGFMMNKEFGSVYTIFLGVSPQNPDMAITATTREAVVGHHQGAVIVNQPVSSIGIEPLANLVTAPDDVLEKLGLCKASMDEAKEG